MALLSKLRNSLTKTRASFTKKLEDIFTGTLFLDAQTEEAFFDVLVQADFGPSAAQKIIDMLREYSEKGSFKATRAWQDVMKETLSGIMEGSEGKLQFADGLSVYLFLGVNGTGKTTSIAKMADYLKQEHGKNIMLCAADTFRAAAIDQLCIWGERLNVPVLAQKEGADPAAVVFDAVRSAKAKNADVLLVDTAGRLQTKVNLMEELKKIRRIIQKECPDGPHESLLALDANFGQNALSQAKLFKEAADITGLILTKLDGSAKGGCIIQIFEQVRVPVKFVGTGEAIGDFQVFNRGEFVAGLFNEPAVSSV